MPAVRFDPPPSSPFLPALPALLIFLCGIRCAFFVSCLLRVLCYPSPLVHRYAVLLHVVLLLPPFRRWIPVFRSFGSVIRLWSCLVFLLVPFMVVLPSWSLKTPQPFRGPCRGVLLALLVDAPGLPCAPGLYVFAGRLCSWYRGSWLLWVRSLPSLGLLVVRRVCLVLLVFLWCSCCATSGSCSSWSWSRVRVDALGAVRAPPCLYPVSRIAWSHGTCHVFPYPPYPVSPCLLLCLRSPQLNRVFCSLIPFPPRSVTTRTSPPSMAFILLLRYSFRSLFFSKSNNNINFLILFIIVFQFMPFLVVRICLQFESTSSPVFHSIMPGVRSCFHLFCFGSFRTLGYFASSSLFCTPLDLPRAVVPLRSPNCGLDSDALSLPSPCAFCFPVNLPRCPSNRIRLAHHRLVCMACLAPFSVFFACCTHVCVSSFRLVPRASFRIWIVSLHPRCPFC